MTLETVDLTIAIDGPAASGKTTIGYMLANRLDYLCLDTGCMYRVVTLAALRRGVNVEDEEQVTELAQQLKIDILPAGDEKDGRLYTVILDKEDVTWDLRTADVDLNVSQVSAYKGVRDELVRRQRLIAQRGRVVVVGRDIGTVVIPGAPLKLYIIASAEERARRRWTEISEREGTADYKQILDDMKWRDRFDGQRQHSPMRPADDALTIDTTGRSPDDIVNEILSLTPFKNDVLY